MTRPQVGYHEFTPQGPMRAVVDRVWTKSAADDEGAEFDVLPDGAVDLIATVHADGSLRTPFVVGAMTKPASVRAADTAFVGIRFLPGAARSVLGVPLRELTDQQARVDELFNARMSRAVSDRMQRLVDSIGDTASFDQSALSAVLQSLSPNAAPPPRDLHIALSDVVRTSGQLRVACVASSLGITRQHLARLFAEHVGLSPKLFAEICRVRALLSLKAQFQRPWTELAAHFGYSDQSHLIAAVHRITGRTPTSWQAGGGSISPIPGLGVR